MKIELAKTEIIHFVGIGGIGMSGLALIMKRMGFNVQGSDVLINKIMDIIFLNFIRRCIISLFSLNQRIQSGLRLLSSLHLPPWLPSSLLSFAHKQFAPDPA